MSDELADLNIKHFKLASGDEVIGLISAHDPTAGILLVEKPLKINTKQLDKDTQTFYFSKYMPMSEDNLVYIHNHNIVAYTNVTTSVKAKYIKTCLTIDNVDEDDLPQNESDEYYIQSKSLH